VTFFIGKKVFKPGVSSLLKIEKGVVQVNTQHKKTCVFCFITLLLIIMLPLPFVSADEPESIVDAVFTFTVESGTTFSIDVDMDVAKLTTYKAFTAQEIAAASDEDRGALRYELFLLLQEQLKGLFGNHVTLVNFTMPVYSGGRFAETLNVKIQSGYFKLNETVDAAQFINGLLDIGAVVSYSFSFSPTPGWINTYIFDLPQKFIFRNTTGTINGDLIEWEVNNRNDTDVSQRGWLSLQYQNPTTTQPTGEDIRLDFSVDTRAVSTTILTATINAYLINSTSYSIFPDTITQISYLPADAVRLAISQGLLTWENIYNHSILPVRNHIVTTLASSLNQSIDAAFSWNEDTTKNCSIPFTLNKMDTNPPLQARVVDNDVRVTVFDETIKAVYGLVNAGATAEVSTDDITIGDAFDAITYPYSSSLFLPAGILLENKTVYPWNASSDIEGQLRSTQAPDYDQEDVNVKITVNMEKLDLDLLSIFSGKTEMTASSQATQTVQLHVASLPNVFTLPHQVSLDYLNADAFRLCIDEHVFSAEDVDLYLNQHTSEFKTHVGQLLDVEEVTAYSDEGVFEESLFWDGDIGTMDERNPLVVSSSAYTLYAIPYSLSLLPPDVNISQQQFLLKGIDGKEGTYRLLFPKGVTIEGSDSLGKTMTFDVDEQGHNYVEITFDETEGGVQDAVMLTLTASPLFMLGLFMPCILSFILAIILVALILFLRRKTKGRSLLKRKPKNDEASYEGQEFYVPPTPPSAR